MNKDLLGKAIRTIPDFPKPGIQFKDITTLLHNTEAYNYSIDLFQQQFEESNLDVVVGIESRGFIFAGPLALRLGIPMSIARKPGKLPGELISAEYDLEYGTDTIEMHTDSVKSGDRVLIMDDLLATGGTAGAVGRLVSQLGGEIVSYSFLINLSFLNGSNVLHPENVHSILEY